MALLSRKCLLEEPISPWGEILSVGAKVIYTKYSLNIDLILWHTQSIVCALKC